MYVTVIELNERTWAYFFLQFTSEVLIVEKTIVGSLYNRGWTSIHNSL